MTNTLQNTAFASFSTSLDEETSGIRGKYESLLLKKGISLDPKILIEIGEFIKRNRILSNEISILEEDFCPTCLKAHIIRHAKTSGMESQEIKAISKAIPGKIGHDGYYIDEEKIFPV